MVLNEAGRIALSYAESIFASGNELLALLRGVAGGGVALRLGFGALGALAGLLQAGVGLRPLGAGAVGVLAGGLQRGLGGFERLNRRLLRGAAAQDGGFLLHGIVALLVEQALLSLQPRQPGTVFGEGPLDLRQPLTFRLRLLQVAAPRQAGNPLAATDPFDLSDAKNADEPTL